MSRFAELQCRFLSAQANEELSLYQNTLHVQLSEILASFPIKDILPSLYKSYHARRYDYLPDDVLNIYRIIEDGYGLENLGKYNKLVFINLMSQVEMVIENQNLPQSFLDALPETLSANALGLLEIPDEEYVYPGDFFQKDLRILTGRSISYRGRLVDLDAYLPHSVYRYNGWRKNLACLFVLIFRTRGLGPFFRGHLDHRHVVHLGSEDYIDYHVRLGELVKNYPHIRGFIGTGWLEDPALWEVSPHTAYRKPIFEDCKAFKRCDGVAEVHTQRALATSKTRRAAYERGEYIPKSYTTIWPRKGMIKWAEKMLRNGHT